MLEQDDVTSLHSIADTIDANHPNEAARLRHIIHKHTPKPIAADGGPQEPPLGT